MVIAVNCIVKWYQFDKLKIILIVALVFAFVEQNIYAYGIMII